MNCVVCHRQNPDKHHIKTRGSGGTDDDWNLIALCRFCHSEIHRIGSVRFIEKYSLQRIFEKKGWTIAEEFGRKRLIRLISADKSS